MEQSELLKVATTALEEIAHPVTPMAERRCAECCHFRWVVEIERDIAKEALRRIEQGQKD